MNMIKPASKNSRYRLCLIFALILFAFFTLLATSACSDDELEESLEQETSDSESGDTQTPEDELMPEESTPEPTEEPEIDRGPFNPLTGEPTEEDISQNRPIAVVLSNLQQALPQNGPSQASIIFEMIAEGDISRMLALYQDYSDVGTLGSVRSARHYSAQIAAGYDAILIASGASPLADIQIRELGITYLTETQRNANIITRDPHRISGRVVGHVHSVVTNGKWLTQYLPDLDIRLTHDGDYKQTLVFTDEATPGGGVMASEVVVRFIAGNNSSFVFNREENVYYMSQSQSGDFIDANNGEQVSFSNLIVIKTQVSTLGGPHGGYGRQDVVTTGSGDGYFVHGGRAIEILWSREDFSSPYVFTLRDGTILELGRGKTYIGIVSDDMEVTFR